MLFTCCLVSFCMTTYGQPTPLKCTDVKNGVFYLYLKDEGYRYAYTRNGDVQTEVNSKTHQTMLWDVKWINECTYTLKYSSGAEDSPKPERDLLKKHVQFIEILNVTEDYYVFKSTFDKLTNPTILEDTCWIKQRRGLSNKPINNPRIDSINKIKQAVIDATKIKQH